MDIFESQRSKAIKNNIFQTLSNEKEKLIGLDRQVFDFSIGTPDFLPSKHVMEAFKNACDNPDNFKYALNDLPELVDAVKYHYHRRFSVNLDSEQIVSAQGSQDIIAHIALSLCDEGDLILVPDPGYPSFSIAPKLMGVELYKYPLYKRDNFVLNFKNIPDEIANRAKFIILCYPSNPTGVVPENSFYDEAIAWAKKHNTIIIHDSAYIDISFLEVNRQSFLSYTDADKVGVELYSLSKTYNLTGARIAFMVGNKNVIRAFRKIKSQIDYGMFIPTQYAAIAALTGGQHNVYAQCALYNSRRHILCTELWRIGWDVPKSDGSLFVWAPIPKEFDNINSEEFSLKLLNETGIIVVPGSAFGELGEGYVRFAIVHDTNVIKQAINNIEQSKFWRDKG